MAPSVSRHWPFVLFLLVAIGFCVWGQRENFGRTIIRSDGAMYYEFLPAMLKYHDPWLSEVLARRPEYQNEIFQYHTWKIAEGRYQIKFPIGPALLWLPFYLAADGVAAQFGWPADGYSAPYQTAVAVGATVYLIMAFVLLYGIGLSRFSPVVLTISTVGLLFGSNLFHYATFDSSFSHVYSFFAVSLWLFCLLRFLEKASFCWGASLGAATGLVFLVRHPNLVVVLGAVPLLWERRHDLRRYGSGMAMAAAGFLAVVSPQVVYCLVASGHVFNVGYLQNQEGFTNWRSPYLYFVLLSPQRGFFFWAPLMIGPALATIASAVRGPLAAFCRGAILVFSVQALLVASWWMPRFGGSFGHRAFVDLLPFLFFGAALAASVMARRRWSYGALLVVVALGCVCSWRLMIGYWTGVVPFGATNLDIWLQALQTCGFSACRPI